MPGPTDPLARRVSIVYGLVAARYSDLVDTTDHKAEQ